jgi:purine-binding chemotaxis protein CheW
VPLNANTAAEVTSLSMASVVSTHFRKAVGECPGGVAPTEQNGRIDDLWLLCQSGSHRFALPIASVIETMRMLPIETVAGAPPLVRGLAIIRGAGVPVIDTARLFGDEFTPYQRLITIRTGERTIAFAASAVLGTQSIQEDLREELPPLLRDVEAIAAIGRLDKELVFFLRETRALPNDFHAGDEVGTEEM